MIRLPARLLSVLLLLTLLTPVPRSSASGIGAAASVQARSASAPAGLAQATTALPIPAPASATPTSVSQVALRVAAGGYHTCTVTAGGGVQCWGANGAGQLGDGTTTDRPAPVAVSGLASGVTAIAAGGSHTCALTTGGGVQCWGYNRYGQLGDGTTTDRQTPVAVSGLASGVTAIAAGWEYTCALTAAGVQCWGNNEYGQLGDGTTDSKDTPVAVSGLASGVKTIAAGGRHTCALTAAGGVQCWGRNDDGQLGDGTTGSRATPGEVSGLTSGVAAIAAGGSHTCALMAAGGVQCWGWNYDGQLGDGTTTAGHTPVAVSGLAGEVTAIAAGGSHTCALMAAGGVQCWGSGHLGDGTAGSRTSPGEVSGLANKVTALAAGFSHTCAVAGGGIKCWGENSYGQLGDGTTMLRTTPVAVSRLASGVTALAAGGEHTCALTVGGSGQCWGRNHFYGQLGDGTTNDRYTPGVVSGLASGVTAIAAGGEHTCAVTAVGVQCWGYNAYGQLGDGTWDSRATPGAVSGLASGVTALAAGEGHTCALTAAGGVQCWGANGAGQLGDGTWTDRLTPVAVSGLANGVTALTAGGFHTCALTATGVQCWGSNTYGQLGNGTTTLRYNTPVAVNKLPSGVTAIAAGQDHTCAVTIFGVQCWGGNYHGQLGDGTTTRSATPVWVSGLTSGVTSLAAGQSHTCAVTTGGGVQCWGWNYYGQLGDGTWDSRNTPVAVSGLASGVTATAAGESHTCALMAGGGVRCWGSNYYGQLGTNPGWTPVNVIGFTVYGHAVYLPLVVRGY